jgi:hypothetical protein
MRRVHQNWRWLCLVCWACEGTHAASEADATLTLDAGAADARSDSGAATECSNTCLDEGDDRAADACRLLDLYEEEVTDEAYGNYLFVDGDTIFYTSGASVRSYDLASHTARTLARVQTNGGIVADETSVYMGGYIPREDKWALYQLPRAGGPLSALRTGLSRVDYLQRTSDRLWFLDTRPDAGNRVRGVGLSTRADVMFALDHTISAFLVDDLFTLRSNSSWTPCSTSPRLPPSGAPRQIRR